MAAPHPWIERSSVETNGTLVPSGRETAAWRRLASDFDELRLAHLSAYLRCRAPDHQIGYSILIFRLDDREVQAALTGPPAELVPHPEITGRPLM